MSSIFIRDEFRIDDEVLFHGTGGFVPLDIEALGVHRDLLQAALLVRSWQACYVVANGRLFLERLKIRARNLAPRPVPFSWTPPPRKYPALPSVLGREAVLLPEHDYFTHCYPDLGLEVAGRGRVELHGERVAETDGIHGIPMLAYHARAVVLHFDRQGRLLRVEDRSAWAAALREEAAASRRRD